MSTAITIIQWAPCLLLEGESLPDGISTSYAERLPGVFSTAREAMDAASMALALRPDAVGYTAKRLEVAHDC